MRLVATHIHIAVNCNCARMDARMELMSFFADVTTDVSLNDEMDTTGMNLMNTVVEVP